MQYVRLFGSSVNHQSEKTVSSTAAVPRSEQVRRQEECGADVGGI